jgi:hypothetical protein
MNKTRVKDLSKEEYIVYRHLYNNRKYGSGVIGTARQMSEWTGIRVARLEEIWALAWENADRSQ